MDDHCKEFLLKNLMDYFDKHFKQSMAIVLAKQQFSMPSFSKL
jgi:hypothetical protein